MAIWAVILSQPINKKATRDPVMALLNEIIIFKGSSQLFFSHAKKTSKKGTLNYFFDFIIIEFV